MELAAKTVGKEILVEVLLMSARRLPIPSFKKMMSERFIEKYVTTQDSIEIQGQYRAGSAMLGWQDNPFHYIVLEQKFNVMCNEDLTIEDIFLRKYINHCPVGYIIWNRSQGKITHKPEEISTYQDDLSFERYKPGQRMPNNFIRFGIPIPPFVSLEKDIFVELDGSIKLQSSLHSFPKKIQGLVRVDNKKWT
jgi:hypothetical protein